MSRHSVPNNSTVFEFDCGWHVSGFDSAKVSRLVLLNDPFGCLVEVLFRVKRSAQIVERNVVELLDILFITHAIVSIQGEDVYVNHGESSCCQWEWWVAGWAE